MNIWIDCSHTESIFVSCSYVISKLPLLFMIPPTTFSLPDIFLEYSFSNWQYISHKLGENSGNRIQHKAKTFYEFVPRSLRVFSVRLASDNRDKNDHFQMTQGRQMLHFFLTFRELYGQTWHCNCIPR